MKFLFLILALFSMSAFAIDRQYDRQIPADRNLQLNKITVGAPNGNQTTDLAVVYGSIVTPTIVVTGTTFDFFKSGTINCSSCGATSGAVTITLNGMSDGGFYTLDMTDSSTATHTFVSAGLTFVYNPASTARTTAKIASYNFHRVGLKVLVSLLEF